MPEQLTTTPPITTSNASGECLATSNLHSRTSCGSFYPKATVGDCGRTFRTTPARSRSPTTEVTQHGSLVGSLTPSRRQPANLLEYRSDLGPESIGGVQVADHTFVERSLLVGGKIFGDMGHHQA